MRSLADRVRHAVTFELVALALLTPSAALLFRQPVFEMGLVGGLSATIATGWNFAYNLGFDRALLRLRGTVQKTLTIRVVHTLLFELGLILLLVPLVAAILGIGLWDALVLDLTIVVFYLVYAFLFNLGYDRLFPGTTPR